MIDHEIWRYGILGESAGFLLRRTAQVGWATEKAFDGAPQAPPLSWPPSPREKVSMVSGGWVWMG